MGADRLRVLHLVAPAIVGGLERVSHALAIGHQRAGHEVHAAVVLTPEEREHPFLTPLEAGGVTVHRLILPVRDYLGERRRVAELCRILAPDIVHSQSTRTDVVDAGIARRNGRPVVTTVHGPSLLGGKAAFYLWLQRRSYRRFDAVCVVSRALQAEMKRRGVSPERIHLIPNAWSGAVDFLPREVARQELGVAPEEFLVGWVGRMIPVKGGDVLIEAVSQLLDLPVRAAMIGDGSERASLESLAARLNVSERVRFVGTRLDAARWFRAFDVFALSSRSEGIPITLFEAMAASVPVVASRVGGVGDVLGTEHALLVPPEDPRSLAEAIRQIHRYPESASRRAAEAQCRLRSDFAYEDWLDRYEQVYRSLVEKARA